MTEISREEFEQAYAERSGMTVEELHTLGLFPASCDCDWSQCQGWKMTVDQSVLGQFIADRQQ